MSRQPIEQLKIKEQRSLFDVADRAPLIKEVFAVGSYEGSRKGVKIAIMYDKHGPKEHKITWSVCLNRQWSQGTSPTVFAAMEDIDATWRNKPLSLREAKKATAEFTQSEEDSEDAD